MEFPAYALERVPVTRQMTEAIGAEPSEAHMGRDLLCVFEDEDPVCGSGHCHIIPYWVQRLGRENVVAYQASKRGGTLYCRAEGNRVFMAGKAALFAECEIYIG